MDLDKDFLGVYSRRDKAGTKTFYFAWQSQDLFAIQKLNAFFQAIEVRKTIDGASFASMFTHEPNIKKLPKSEDKYTQPKQRKIISAREVEMSLRELFRKATVRIKRSGSEEEATPILNNLLQVEEGITPKHKHMFRDFGAEMRKQKCYNHAKAFSERTLALSHNDDHAHFNLARVLIDMGEYDEAEQHILTAQYLNPDSRIYKRTLHHISVLRMQKERFDARTPGFLDDL